MGMGISVLLLVVGLVILTDAVTLPTAVTDNVDAHLIGWICVVVAVLGFALSVFGRGRGDAPPEA